MSGFFEPPLPSEPEIERRPQHQPWHGPPRNVMGGSVPERLILARTDRAALTIESLTAFETGFAFALVVRGRPSEDEWDDTWDPFAARHWARRRGRERSKEIDPELLLFGIQFSDGSKATNLGYQLHEDESPIPPVLFEQGGGGGGTEWRQDYWVWPLPPSGPVAFVCEWPARGITLSRVEIDAERIRDAAALAETLWPEEAESGTHTSSTWITGLIATNDEGTGEGSPQPGV
jgi:hypothetical protein